MRAPTILGFAIAAALCGCSSGKYSAADTGGASGADGDTSEGGAVGGDTGSSENDTGPPANQPELYGIGGQLDVFEGVVSGGNLELTFEDETRNPSLTCVETRAIEAVVSQKEVPDPVIFHWVQVTLAPSDKPCTGSTGVLDSKEGLYLGLGTLHVDLLPALAGDGYDTDAAGTWLYGVYAAIPGDASCAGDSSGTDACVYGYAGTEGNLAGKTKAEATGPVPDGSYALNYVYLFEVDP